MKKGDRKDADDLRPEYDFASMQGGVQGKYAHRVRESSNIVLLDPDVAKAFPTEGSVNGALRSLIKKKITPTHSGGGADSRVRDVDGEIRRRRSDTLVRTLRETYGDDFARGYRSDTPLEKVLDDAGVSTLSEYLRRRK